MLSGGIIGCTRERLERVWSSRLAMPLRPASSAGTRDRGHRCRRHSRGAGQRLAPAGSQSPQVTFTALFALLLGGHQPFAYITHRMIDVGIGVATGVAVNILVFPPLQLRPAEHAIRQWATTSPVPWRISALPPPNRTPACRPGRGTTAS